MTIEDFSEATTILAKYCPDGSFELGDDEITFGVDPAKVSLDDTVRLEELGVFSAPDEDWFYCFT